MQNEYHLFTFKNIWTWICDTKMSYYHINKVQKQNFIHGT